MFLGKTIFNINNALKVNFIDFELKMQVMEAHKVEDRIY